MTGEFDDEVVDIHPVGGAAIAHQPLQAAWAGGEDACMGGGGIAGGNVLFEFFLFAESQLGGNVRTGDGQRSGFAAASVGERDRSAHQGVDNFDARVLFHRGVAGVVEEVVKPRFGPAFAPDAFFQQVFVDVQRAKRAGLNMLLLIRLD